jgi:hypothetical protein
MGLQGAGMIFTSARDADATSPMSLSETLGDVSLRRMERECIDLSGA